MGDLDHGDSKEKDLDYGANSEAKLPSSQPVGKGAAKLPQVSAAVIATLGSFLCGTALAWSAPALPSLQEDLCGDDCDVPGISAEDGSWIGALMPAGAVFSGAVAGWLLGRVGRRWTMVLCAVPFLVGSLLFYVAYEVGSEVPIYFGRVLTGFSGGSFLLVGPMYIAEVAESQLRGALMSLSQLMLTLGVTYDNALSINGAVEWYVISAILAAVPVVICAGMFFMPESPVYLLSKGRERQALNSLVWLRGGEGHEVLEELEALKEARREQEAVGTVPMSALVTRPVYARPFAVVMFLMLLQQSCGVNVVTFYIQTIFTEAGSDMDPGLSATLVNVASLAGNVAAILVVDRLGRKVLLLASSVLMGLSLFLLGTFFYMLDNEEIRCPEETDALCEPQEGKFDSDTIDDLTWLPLTSLMVYTIAFSIGLGPLPFAINAEIFLPEARSVSASVAGAFNWLCAFIVTKFESDLEEAIGAYGAYFLYASCCVAGAAVVLLFVPETKNASPQEIRDRWIRGKKKRRRRGSSSSGQDEVVEP